MIFGMAQGVVMCWPTKDILAHRFEFARYCRANAWRFRNMRIIVNHPLNRRTIRWCKWLGLTVEQGVFEPCQYSR